MHHILITTFDFSCWEGWPEDAHRQTCRCCCYRVISECNYLCVFFQSWFCVYWILVSTFFLLVKLGQGFASGREVTGRASTVFPARHTSLHKDKHADMQGDYTTPSLDYFFQDTYDPYIRSPSYLLPRDRTICCTPVSC